MRRLVVFAGALALATLSGCAGGDTPPASSDSATSSASTEAGGAPTVAADEGGPVTDCGITADTVTSIVGTPYTDVTAQNGGRYGEAGISGYVCVFDPPDLAPQDILVTKVAGSGVYDLLVESQGGQSENAGRPYPGVGARATIFIDKIMVILVAEGAQGTAVSVNYTTFDGDASADTVARLARAALTPRTSR